MSEYEMKETLRNSVRHAWDNLMLKRNLYGEEDKRTITCTGKWLALDNLWTELFPDEEY